MWNRPKLKRSVICASLPALAILSVSMPAPGPGSMSPLAWAQSANPELSQQTPSADPTPSEQPPETAVPEERPPSATGIEPTTESERELHARRLDELFTDLAEVGNAEWQQIQDSIWEAWSQSGSPSMDLLLQRAEQAMREGKMGVAMVHLNDLVRLAPDFPEGWNKRATVLFLRGEYNASVADIQKTLKLEPRHFGALSGLGTILERLGDQEGALLAYQRVLEIHPNMDAARAAVERLTLEVGGREL